MDDQSPAGLTIFFGGLSDMKGETATVAADGTFTVTVTLTAGESGNVTANVTDVSGRGFPQASTYIFSA